MRFPHALLPLGLLLCASVASAAPTFQDAWVAASDIDPQPAAYWTRLQAYFDSGAFDDDRCQDMLRDGDVARLLLAFDPDGKLTVRGEGHHAAAEDCAARAFLDHPPPHPEALPFVVPFRLER